MRISDWSSDVCSSDLRRRDFGGRRMTDFFQSFLGFDFGWFVATLIGILLIALPLMLAVAMLIYADRKIWAAMALRRGPNVRSEEHTSELQSLMRISYAVFCLTINNKPKFKQRQLSIIQ